jgi:hypothetical protein
MAHSSLILSRVSVKVMHSRRSLDGNIIYMLGIHTDQASTSTIPSPSLAFLPLGRSGRQGRLARQPFEGVSAH